MQDLINRLERATGPDRRLDVAIYVAEFPHPCVEMDAAAQDKFDAERAPSYTSSIDAALTLVPEGIPWEVSSDRISKSLATVCTTKNNGQYIDETLKGAGPLNTPAIALCIAALRARAATSVERSPAMTPSA